MSRVLILSLVFSPDGVSTAQLMSELAVDLRRNGHDVTVISTRPHYNRDPVAEAAQPLSTRWPGLLWQSHIDGVRVYHTRVSAKSGGLASRMAGWLLFHLVATVAALVLVRRADVIFVPSPLLTLGALGRVLRLPLRARMVYNVQELYPDLAVEMGVLRSRPLIALLRALERFVYRGAAVVTAITDGIRDAIVHKGIPASRVVTIPNFVDVADLKPAPKANDFAAGHGWTDRFVVLYAGNIGHAQGLEALLAAARHLVDDPRVLVAFVGEGAAREALEAEARAEGLANVTFIGHQPYALVPEIYAASDLCVVSLVGDVRVGALPSKVFRIMACARPILALCDPSSDLGELVRRVGAGEVRAPNDAAGVAAAITALEADRARASAMGARGRAYVLEHLTRPAVTGRYAELFTALSREAQAS